jgi:hypothetical protein
VHVEGEQRRAEKDGGGELPSFYTSRRVTLV